MAQKKRKFSDLGKSLESQAKKIVEERLHVGMARNDLIHLTERGSGKAICENNPTVTQMNDYYDLSMNRCLPCDTERKRRIEAESKRLLRNPWGIPEKAQVDGYEYRALPFGEAQ
jgi:hypothetical protein